MAGLQDSSDSELGVPGQASQPANPFSPVSPAGAAGSPMNATNEQRLMQVLESVTLLLQTQTAARESSSSKPMLSGKDLARVIKQPEAFDPRDREAELAKWPGWSWQFEQWLTCIHSEFASDIHRIRANMNVPIVQTTLTADERDRSRLLFGIVAGLLHEKGCRMLKTISESNGFEAYRRLVQDLTPSSRSRLLALIQMVHSWPAFNMKIGLIQQLAKFESAVHEYESLSGTTMSDDAKLASVLRCLSGQLKTQAMIHVTESSTYNDLRRLIERWENGQARWNDALASAYGIGSHHPKADPNDTSAPMEIDRVKGKGKGKPDKGKGKGAKGKGKVPDATGRGKGSSKAKGKGRGQDASGKGAKVCNFCKKPGHFKRDCFAFKAQQKAQGYVQQVEQGAASSSSAAGSGAQANQASQGNKGRVNRLEFGIPLRRKHPFQP